MSFKNLKQKFELENDNLRSMEPFKRLYLAAMFEINGNLDTLALSSRALLVLLEKVLASQNEENEANAKKRQKADDLLRRFVDLQEKAASEATAAKDRWAETIMGDDPLRSQFAPVIADERAHAKKADEGTTEKG